MNTDTIDYRIKKVANGYILTTESVKDGAVWGEVEITEYIFVDIEGLLQYLKDNLK